MTRFGYSIFCDDIRNEINGKLTFVGCYNGAMFVSGEFPVMLPKLCAHMHVLTDVTQPFESIVARLYFPGEPDPIIEERLAVPAPPQQREMVSKVAPQGREPRYLVVSASLIVSPVSLVSPGLIRVRAVVDGQSDEMKIGSLRVAAGD